MTDLVNVKHKHNILQDSTLPMYTGWRLGIVASVVHHMNEVTIHWARLVLGWVTVFGRVYHHGV